VGDFARILEVLVPLLNRPPADGGGSSTRRLDTIEDRLSQLERRVGSLEQAVFRGQAPLGGGGFGGGRGAELPSTEPGGVFGAGIAAAPAADGAVGDRLRRLSTKDLVEVARRWDAIYDEIYGVYVDRVASWQKRAATRPQSPAVRQEKAYLDEIYKILTAPPPAPMPK